MDESSSGHVSTSAFTTVIIDVDLSTTKTEIMMDDLEDGESAPCVRPLEITKVVTLAVAMVLMIATLITLLCHYRLRKRHHIFPCNLVLADLSGAVVFTCFESFKNYEPAHELYMFLVVLLATSFLVSLLSIMMVTIYQFITIRVDPFGSRHLVTTPRVIVTCFLTWGISFGISSAIAFIEDDHLFIFILTTSWTTSIVTGICYVLIYRSVSRVPCTGNISRERKKQNQRVLRTFGLIFATTVLCWICPWVNWSLQGFHGVDNNHCFNNAGDIMICINWTSNCLIYWWRLKEFRTMFLCQTRRRKRSETMETRTSLVSDISNNISLDVRVDSSPD